MVTISSEGVADPCPDSCPTEVCRDAVVVPHAATPRGPYCAEYPTALLLLPVVRAY